jgi:hypothetical protein
MDTEMQADSFLAEELRKVEEHVKEMWEEEEHRRGKGPCPGEIAAWNEVDVFWGQLGKDTIESELGMLGRHQK